LFSSAEYREYRLFTIEELHSELKKQHGLFLQYIDEDNHLMRDEASNLVSLLIKLLDDKLRSE